MKLAAYLLRQLCIACLCALFLWCTGLAWFAASILPSSLTVTENATEKDAIVVLTGGSGRLDYGLKLLIEHKGRKLFISGVEDNIPLGDLFKENADRKLLPGLKDDIDIGYVARDTKGNALETAEWMDMHKFKSIRLVTANYHMPRSLFEFRQLMPHVEINPDPVFPPPFNSSRWIFDAQAMQLVLSEYHKYLATRIHALLL